MTTKTPRPIGQRGDVRKRLARPCEAAPTADLGGRSRIFGVPVSRRAWVQGRVKQLPVQILVGDAEFVAKCQPPPVSLSATRPLPLYASLPRSRVLVLFGAH